VYTNNQTARLPTVLSRKQLVNEEQPTLVNRTKLNVNTRDVSRVNVATDVQPLSTGTRLRSANPGYGWLSCIITIQI